MPGCSDRSDLTVSKLTRIFSSRRLMRVPEVLVEAPVQGRRLT